MPTTPWPETADPMTDPKRQARWARRQERWQEGEEAGITGPDEAEEDREGPAP